MGLLLALPLATVPALCFIPVFMACSWLESSCSGCGKLSNPCRGTAIKVTALKTRDWYSEAGEV